TRGEKRLFLILLALSGITLLLIAIFYALNPSSVLGESLVTTQNGTPVEFPPPGSFPFYMKPVTIFFVACVVFSYSFFSLAGKRIESRLPRVLRAFLLVVSITVFAISAYEVLFNFTLWGSLLVSNPNPDLAVNTYPTSRWQTNLVFATKAYVSLLFISYFALATFRRSLQAE
ncbi:MAG: hypothetical protein ACREBQ_09275, partial [Nitrososphaerales archaeon]